MIDEKFGDNLEFTPEQYARLSTKSHVIQKGQEFKRITKRQDEDLRDLTYVSYKKGDVDIYRSIMSLPPIGGFGGHKSYKNTYEATFKSLTTLKSPSEKERVDAFIDLFDNPKVPLKNGKTVTGREFLKNSMYAKEVKTLTSQQLGLMMYKEFASGQFMDAPLNTAYFNEVKRRGYNSVVDDNDRGHLTKAPLIVLNPNGSLKKISIKPLSADDINAAQRRLKVDTPSK